MLPLGEPFLFAVSHVVPGVWLKFLHVAIPSVLALVPSYHVLLCTLRANAYCKHRLPNSQRAYLCCTQYAQVYF
jgi:hypothetical protein